MSVETDTPFEFEIVAEYLSRGDSVVYLTKHDPEHVGQALLRLGMEREEISERLYLKAPDTSTEEFGMVISKIRPDRVMADSVADIFKLRSSLIQKGLFSCKVNERSGR